MEAHWKLNINLFVLAHQLLQEHITEYDDKKYKEFSTFLQNLQRKKFDALTVEDSTKLHTYIHFLIDNYYLKHFTAECLQWSYTVHLVDSNIIKKEIKEGNARTAQHLSDLESSQQAQFAEIEKRLSTLQNKYPTTNEIPIEILKRLRMI